MTELLLHPTLELTHALGELMYALGDAGAAAAVCALGDDGAAAAPHTGAAMRSQRCDCCARLGIRGYCGFPIPEQSHSSSAVTVSSPRFDRPPPACLMMELLCTLNADNGQIFLGSCVRTW